LRKELVVAKAKKRTPRKKKETAEEPAVEEVEEVVEEVPAEEEVVSESEKVEEEPAPKIKKAPVHSPTEPEAEALARPKIEIHPVATLEEAIELCGGEDKVNASAELETEFVIVFGSENKKVRIPKNN